MNHKTLAQSLLIQDLSSYLSTNESSISDKVLMKGFVYAGTNRLDTININNDTYRSLQFRWKCTKSNKEKEWIYKSYDTTYCDVNLDTSCNIKSKSVEYVTYSKTNYLTLKSSMLKNHYKLLKSEIFEETLLATYENEKYVVRVFNAKDGSWEISIRLRMYSRPN